MSDLLDGYRLGEGGLCVGTLSRETIEAEDALHLGEDRFFLYHEDLAGAGIVVLAKFPSDEAALRLIDLLSDGR